MNGAGYVYVLAFSNGTVKVGRTQNAGQRMSAHRLDARKFGLEITGEWVSPLHAGWLLSEDALKAIAAELGGTAASKEYFTGVDFAAVVERAQALRFPADDPAVKPRKGPRKATPRLNETPAWLKDEIAVSASRISCGWYVEEERVEHLADQILRSDPDLSRLLAEQYVRKSLKVALRRNFPEPPSFPEPPEPPESPPLTGDPTVSDALERLAKAA